MQQRCFAKMYTIYLYLHAVCTSCERIIPQYNLGASSLGISLGAFHRFQELMGCELEHKTSIPDRLSVAWCLGDFAHSVTLLKDWSHFKHLETEKMQRCPSTAKSFALFCCLLHSKLRQQTTLLKGGVNGGEWSRLD